MVGREVISLSIFLNLGESSVIDTIYIFENSFCFVNYLIVVFRYRGWWGGVGLGGVRGGGVRMVYINF